MDLDPLSFITPARVKTLLLPIGHVRESRFGSFVKRLQHVNVVRLGDVSPDRRPHRTMFSPLAFPEGLVLYDLSTAVPPSPHLALAPFEIYREPLVVVGIADGRNIEVDSTKGNPLVQAPMEAPSMKEGTSYDNALESLSRDLDEIQQEYPRALVHQILVFDHSSSPLPSGIYPVLPPEKSRTTTVKTVMCDLTSRLLAEMTIYAKSLLALPSLDSPRVLSGSATLNGTASALPAHMTGLSRPGSTTENSRPFSPANDPAHLPSTSGSGASTPDSRATSPPGGVGTSPTSFNEINGSAVIQPPSKSSSHDNSRAGSRDKISINGFGAGSLGERERNKGKGRIGVVIGALYLLAGRWPDAVKELVQSATTARSSSDYVWHAKAMDYILVCLLMYAWAGMDFRIPDILFPSLERSNSGSSKPSTHAPSNSLAELSGSKSVDPADRVANLRILTNLLPDLTKNILNLYSRAWTFTDDKIPPLAFSQSSIRFAKLLTAIHLSGGSLDDDLLRHLVLNAEFSKANDPLSVISTSLTKGELANLTFRAYPRPLPESTLSIADHTATLAGIASVLSELGYHRKKALVLKDLVSGLLPSLVQARKDGAADMGVHPAASLASSLSPTVGAIPLEGLGASADDSEQGMRHLLSLVCHAYGIESVMSLSDQRPKGVLMETRKSPHLNAAPTAALNSEVTVARVMKQASAKAFGSQGLKISILRSCLNMCEALPDLYGALRYSAELLRLAGSGIAPGPDDSNGSPDLPIEEQVRLANNISRTLSAAQQLGLENIEVDYWDEFLVRGIEVMEANPSRVLLPHAKPELETVETIETKKEKNPFIYNPFLKTRGFAAAEHLLVAQEEAFFRVTLQNLYDFDLVIERLKLESDGVWFECSSQATVIGPYRTQTLLLSGIPQAAGSLTISGCAAKIRGCRERSFITFSEPWALKPDVKGRHFRLAEKARPTFTASDPGLGKVYRPPEGPTASALSLDVIGSQPIISVASISLPQSALMLLEGETKCFTITLLNTARTSPADLILLSFDDPTAPQRQSVIANKQLSSIELYDLEHASAHKPAFQWLRQDSKQDLQIAPGAEATLEFEVFGKPGLSYGMIQVDYGYLGIPKADITDRFYTRQLAIPIAVTVNASIDLIRNDIITLPSDVSWPRRLQQPQISTEAIDPSYQDASTQQSFSIDGDSIQPLLNHVNFATTKPLCLLLLDLRNSWPSTLTTTIKLSDPSSKSPLITHTLSLNPGTTHRIPIPLPRLYLPNAHAPIPSLDPASKRQFVVSATESSPEAERAMREAFWYREALLDYVKATWKEDGTGRTGNIELRGLRLTPRMVSSLKLEELDIQMSVTTSTPDSSEGMVKQHGPSRFSVPPSAFLNLRTLLHNRSSTSIHPILQLQPALANQPHNIALDMSKRLLVNGVLQRSLPVLGPGERREVETGFCVLSEGIYEWGASVEEVRGPAKATGDARKGARERAVTGESDVLIDTRRRIWRAEERCVVVASDEDRGEDKRI